MNNFLDSKLIINGSLANILAAVVLFVLSMVFLDRKKVLAPWIYKYFSRFGKFIVSCLIFLEKIIINPIFRIILAGAFLALINYKGGDLVFSLLILFILWSFLWKSKKESIFLPSPKISDGFEKLDLNIWEVKTGNPIIEENFGKPAPDLGLSVFPEKITDSFIILKNENVEKGVIECDFYLEENALFNVVFFGDIEQETWYMARYDSRANYSDGFIIKNIGESWKEFKMAGTRTTTRQWHRARVEFDSIRVAMYLDNSLIMEFSNPKIFGKKIGMFNELNFVHVDNFSFIEK